MSILSVHSTCQHYLWQRAIESWKAKLLIWIYMHIKYNSFTVIKYYTSWQHKLPGTGFICRLDYWKAHWGHSTIYNCTDSNDLTWYHNHDNNCTYSLIAVQMVTINLQSFFYKKHSQLPGKPVVLLQGVQSRVGSLHIRSTKFYQSRVISQPYNDQTC